MNRIVCWFKPLANGRIVSRIDALGFSFRSNVIDKNHQQQQQNKCELENREEKNRKTETHQKNNNQRLKKSARINPLLAIA